MIVNSFVTIWPLYCALHHLETCQAIVMEHLYILLPFAFLVGTCMGSFVTMASYRIPLGLDIVFRPSYCPPCGANLTPRELFPLLSWFLQKGLCLHCKTPISIRYPLTEIALGSIFTALAWQYGFGMQALFYALLATELAILIVTDLEHFIIPDSIQAALLITGATYDVWRFADINDVAGGVALGLAIGLSLHYGYLYLRKKDALGWGDVKFLAVAGVWLPPVDFVPFLFLSGVIGIVTGLTWRRLGRGPVFPFGPALALSLFINVLIPDILARL